MRPQNRKINSKGRPVPQTKNYNCVYLSNKHIDLEQRRPAHAKPDFNWLSGPRNGTWKRTCGISCLRSLAPMRRLRCSTTQATFTNPSLLRATPRYSATPCYVLIQLPNVIDTISKRWRSKKAFNTSPHLPTSFPKQILAPSRFKFILLINNGIDWNDHKTCSFWAENFGRSLEGQEGPTRGSKVFNTIIQMEADHLRENPQTPQQQETLQAIT